MNILRDIKTIDQHVEDIKAKKLGLFQYNAMASAVVEDLRDLGFEVELSAVYNVRREPSGIEDVVGSFEDVPQVWDRLWEVEVIR